MKKIISLIFVLAIGAPAIIYAQSAKKVVLIAGTKTHGDGEHEYVKTVQQLKLMLDNSENLKGVKTEIAFDGWPKDPSTLNDADVIMFYADGSDDKEDHDPLLVGDHLSVIEKQMKRGCGLMLVHYSTFAPSKYSTQFLNWVGGYFDYETGKPGASGREAWYSDIKTDDAKVIPTEGHPIAEGVKAFEEKEEFYFKIHFQEKDSRLKPVLRVLIPGVEKIQTIAWTVERKDGGRGFGYTGGHFYYNMKNVNYRKLLLNAIVWTAGATVPPGGVESKYYSDEDITRLLK